MLYDGADLKVSKTKGKVFDLEAISSNEITLMEPINMGYTRWVTHGVPNDLNSHPHLSNSGDLAIIHNGIIGYQRWCSSRRSSRPCDWNSWKFRCAFTTFDFNSITTFFLSHCDIK